MFVRVLTVAALLAAPLCASTLGKDFNREGAPKRQAAPAKKVADPEDAPPAVMELAIQDPAFALLSEAYRQFQTFLIQSDYEERLIDIKSKVSDPEAARTASDLARQERDLRLQTLHDQQLAMNAAYEHAREAEAREYGINVPVKLDTKTAAKKLENFVVIAPASGDPSDIGSTITMPASTVLVDKVPKR